VTPIHYKGIVWCVKVPTGAFVARRNGKVFITGNSGFPKATRIDTQIDRAAGKLEEREIIGKKKLTGNAKVKGSAGGIPGNYLGAHRGTGCLIDNAEDGQAREIRDSIPITAPATDLARAWQSHRYGLQALKPAVEPIICAQKPYSGKPVECIVDTGAGALWIDGGRVVTNWDEYPESWKRSGKSRMPGETSMIGIGGVGIKTNKGRWPPNFALVHCPPHLACRSCQAVHPIQPVVEVCPDCGGELERVEGCKRAGVKRVKGTAPRGGPTSGKETDSQAWGLRCNYGKGYADPDGREAVADWDCRESCPARRLGEMSGELGNALRSKRHIGKQTENSLFGKRQLASTYPDSGTAARFYPQVSWEHEEMECCAQCPVARLDEQAGEREVSGTAKLDKVHKAGAAIFGSCESGHESMLPRDSGGASRFYVNADWQHEVAEQLAQADPVRYVPKAAKKERSSGLDDFYWRRDKDSPTGFVRVSKEEWEALPKRQRARGNIHSTVKPMGLLKWLATLLLPPPEYAPRRILVPFSGSGSEAISAALIGFEDVVAIEMLRDYCDIAKARAAFWSTRQLELPAARPAAGAE